MDNIKRRSSLSSIDYKNKRTSSLETYFNSQNINDISAKNKINKLLKENHVNHDSKSTLNLNLKPKVSK